MMRASTHNEFLTLATAVFLLLASPFATATPPESLLDDLSNYPHAQQVSTSTREVIDHEIGLGAMRKIRGEWQFKDSERLSGTLVSYTWQIVDGFTSASVLQRLLEAVEALEGSQLLFACEGRSCGHGAQWANRVFKERVLYGREDLQRYAVYALAGDVSYRLVAYSAARTASRQYLRVDLLKIED